METLTFSEFQKLSSVFTTTKTKQTKLDSHHTNQCRTKDDAKHNESTFKLMKPTFRRSDRTDQSQSTTTHNCVCLPRYIAYFLAQNKRSMTFTLHITLIYLCFAAITPTTLARTSTHIQTAALRSTSALRAGAADSPSPVAASLLSNNAALPSFATLNTNASTTLLAYEKNSLELTVGAAKPVPALENRRALKLAFLNNASVVCNDGSRAGFYLRKNPNSKKWIVFLEGGWHCYDARSCRARWLRLRHLMTSAQWPDTRDVGGILSPLPEENPYWHNANHVLVPYCSSDSWSGTRANIEGTAEWRFMGAVIIRQVIAELIPLGLGRAPGAELLLVGSSAGGLGVMLNLDRVTNYLQNERNLMVTVRGISDSGWFLDREPYTPAAVGSLESVRQGWKLWRGSLPESCTKQYQTEPWRCYFGYRLYPTLQTPLFVFQWLFDEAQMRADNVGAPVTPQQWNYIHEMGGALRSSLDNVTGVFAPSCIGHAVLSKRDWTNIQIDEISLPTALRCWEHSTRPRRRRHNDKQQQQHHHQHELVMKEHNERQRLEQHKTQNHHRPTEQYRKRNNRNDHKKKSNNFEPQNGGTPQRRSKAEREERRRLRHERQQRRLHRKKHQQNNNKHHQNRHGHRRNEAKLKRNNNLAPNVDATISLNAPTRRSNKHSNKNGGEHKNQPTEAHKKRKWHQRQQLKDGFHTPLRHDHNLQQQQRQQQQQHEPPISESSTKLEVQKNHATNEAGLRRHNRVPRVPEKCVLRLLERCSWPQCNHSCPMVTNPMTGEEMRFLELLTSFGLDIEAVAAALGLDMQTLNNMDRTELVNLLTQQAS